MAERRFIDANEAMAIANECYLAFSQSMADLIDLKDLFEDCTIYELKPVVHAHWALFGNDGTDTDYGCTNCGYTFTTSGDYPQSVHYCPYCGAQMDESEDKNEIF